MWRAIKNINIKSFNIDSRDIENLFLKVVKLKERAQKRSGAAELDIYNQEDINSSNHLVDIDTQFDQYEQNFRMQIKKDIMSDS